jgi:hypothetical protein
LENTRFENRDEIPPVHRGTLKASRDLHHTRTNSILQQVKKKISENAVTLQHCSEFHE